MMLASMTKTMSLVIDDSLIRHINRAVDMSVDPSQCPHERRANLSDSVPCLVVFHGLYLVTALFLAAPHQSSSELEQDKLDSAALGVSVSRKAHGHHLPLCVFFVPNKKV